MYLSDTVLTDRLPVGSVAVALLIRSPTLSLLADALAHVSTRARGLQFRPLNPGSESSFPDMPGKHSPTA